MKNYKEVPKMISNKDIQYLTDMFNWNLIKYKETINSKNLVMDVSLQQKLTEAADLFYENMNAILKILGGKYE